MFVPSSPLANSHSSPRCNTSLPSESQPLNYPDNDTRKVWFAADLFRRARGTRCPVRLSFSSITHHPWTDPRTMARYFYLYAPDGLPGRTNIPSLRAHDFPDADRLHARWTCLSTVRMTACLLKCQFHQSALTSISKLIDPIAWITSPPSHHQTKLPGSQVETKIFDAAIPPVGPGRERRERRRGGEEPFHPRLPTPSHALTSTL